MSKTEEVLPFIILAAVAGFAASRFLYPTVAPAKQTAKMKAEMQDLHQIRKIKQEYLDAQETQAKEEDDEAPDGPRLSVGLDT